MSEASRWKPLSRAPHRFIPTCDINQNWWDCYYAFMTCCRGPRGLDYWAYPLPDPPPAERG